MSAIRSFYKKAILTILVAGTMASPAGADELDTKAWNAVWDKFMLFLPANTPDEEVHALKIVQLATWGDGELDGLRELQRLGGAIPAKTWETDPSRLSESLFSVYKNVVLDVVLPGLSAEQERTYLSATTEFETAFDAFDAKRTVFQQRWDTYAAQLTAQGKPINAAAELRFQEQQSGFWTATRARLRVAGTKLQNAAASNQGLADAVQLLRNYADDVMSGRNPGLVSYNGSAASLRAISADCANDGNGWDELSYSKTTASNRVRASDWNAGGSWSGAFVKFGLDGGAGTYSADNLSAGENVTIRLCNLTYIPISPGYWFDPAVLKAIDAGRLKLKAGSSYAGKPILGPDGAIPRLVKGVIVARRISFLAQMESAKLSEFKRRYSGSGGFSFGPIRIGGSAGGLDYNLDTANETGKYGRSTNTTVPVVLAIVTEPTPRVTAKQ